jgi:hypothetical protein
MKKELAITHRLALRGKNVEQLRELAGRYLTIEPSATPAKELTEKLSAAATKDPNLARELGESPISLKPSFYLMIATLAETGDIAKKAQQKSAVFFDKVNEKLKKASEPALKDFQVITVSRRSPGIVEMQVTWHQIMRYWSTSAVLEHVYTLRLGFVFIDAATSKALICCHSVSERDVITEALEEQLDIQFTPITLTKQLLERIGSFEQVRRAGYLVTNPGPQETLEVTYADESLAAKPSVRAQENNPKYFRKHSFYRIDLGGLSETGLGVTADTAKLWIPSETPIESVRDYGLLLLKKFTATLKKMKEDGDIPGILGVLTLQGSHALGRIPGGELRSEIAVLAHELIQMLLSNQTERPYTPPSVFLTRAIPDWFSPARLQIEDEATGDVGFWSAPDKQTQFIAFSLQQGKWQARTFSGSEVIDLGALLHPVTGNPVQVGDPLRGVELWPTRQLHEALLDAVRQASTQLPKLKKVAALPFYIHAGRIVIDLPNARSQEFADSLNGELALEEVDQFGPALQSFVSPTHLQRLDKQLQKLNEKCVHMTDDNCEACLEQRRFLCLRSLLARFMSQRLLLMHKGIELSDLQGTLKINGAARRVWVFSKVAKGKSGLTLRNASGAILLAQIIAQLDKSTFNTVAVLSPSTVNEDLRERLTFLAGLVGKKVVVVNKPILEKMLAHFEEQTKFDKKDPRKVYSASRSKRAKGHHLEAAGPFI